jgi:hypothetical protein
MKLGSFFIAIKTGTQSTLEMKQRDRQIDILPITVDK